MGKNRDIQSLIDLIVNTIVHEIIVRHTNRPESKPFVSAEIVEYRSQTKKVYQLYHWNSADKEQIRERVLQGIMKKLESKYSDIPFSKKEAQSLIDEEMEDLER
jgi:hypothetical protein